MAAGEFVERLFLDYLIIYNNAAFAYEKFKQNIRVFFHLESINFFGFENHSIDAEWRSSSPGVSFRPDRRRFRARCRSLTARGSDRDEFRFYRLRFPARRRSAATTARGLAIASTIAKPKLLPECEAGDEKALSSSVVSSFQSGHKKRSSSPKPDEPFGFRW